MKNIQSLDALAESLVRLTRSATMTQAQRAARRAYRRAWVAKRERAARLERAAVNKVARELEPFDQAGVDWYAARGAVMRGEALGRADRVVLAMQPRVRYARVDIELLTAGGKGSRSLWERDLIGAGLVEICPGRKVPYRRQARRVGGGLSNMITVEYRLSAVGVAWREILAAGGLRGVGGVRRVGARKTALAGLRDRLAAKDGRTRKGKIAP